MQVFVQGTTSKIPLTTFNTRNVTCIVSRKEAGRVGGKKKQQLTSTIFSMCFLMMVGSALGFTDTAQSSIMVGLGSGAGVGLEFCCEAGGKAKPKDIDRTAGEKLMLWFYKGSERLLRVKMLWENKDFQYVPNAATNSYSRMATVGISAILCKQKGGGCAKCGGIKLRGPWQFAAHRWLSRFSLERHLVDLFLGVVLVQRNLHKERREILSWRAIMSKVKLHLKTAL